MKISMRYANHIARAILGDIRPRTRHVLAYEQRRLMCAVVDQALFDLRDMPEGSLAHEDARRWMKSTRVDYLFAFERLCQLLGLDSNAVREKMRDERAEMRRAKQ